MQTAIPLVVCRCIAFLVFVQWLPCPGPDVSPSEGCRALGKPGVVDHLHCFHAPMSAMDCRSNNASIASLSEDSIDLPKIVAVKQFTDIEKVSRSVYLFNWNRKEMQRTLYSVPGSQPRVLR